MKEREPQEILDELATTSREIVALEVKLGTLRRRIGRCLAEAREAEGLSIERARKVAVPTIPRQTAYRILREHDDLAGRIPFGARR